MLRDLYFLHLRKLIVSYFTYDKIIISDYFTYSKKYNKTI